MAGHDSFIIGLGARQLLDIGRVGDPCGLGLQRQPTVHTSHQLINSLAREKPMEDYRLCSGLEML